MTKETHHIQIFRPGTYTAKNGKVVSFSEQDVQKAAETFDPNKFSVPVVVGHPKHDKPAYGWAKNVSFSDGLLSADVDVASEFADVVRNGSYKKISASFFDPNAKNNPNPGTHTLKHIGFLGAAAPAVSGLQDVSFSDDEGDILTFEFSEEDWSLGWSLKSIARTFRNIKGWLIEKEGREKANEIINDWDVDDVSDTAAELRHESKDTAFSDEESDNKAQKDNSMSQEKKPTPEDETNDFAEREASLTEREKALADREAELDKQRADALAKDNLAFCEDLASNGKIAPGMKDDMVTFMNDLGNSDELSFSEDNKQTPLDFFKGLFDAASPVIDFSEHSEDGGKGDGSLDFSDSDALAAAVTEKITEATGKGQTLSSAQAMAALRKEHGVS